MGSLKRSENSLNQHIKLKHPELWGKIKDLENEANKQEAKEEEALKISDN